MSTDTIPLRTSPQIQPQVRKVMKLVLPRMRSGTVATPMTPSVPLTSTTQTGPSVFEPVPPVTTTTAIIPAMPVASPSTSRAVTSTTGIVLPLLRLPPETSKSTKTNLESPPNTNKTLPPVRPKLKPIPTEHLANTNIPRVNTATSIVPNIPIPTPKVTVPIQVPVGNAPWDFKYIYENIKAICTIVDGHWLLKNKRMREGKKFRGHQRGANQWLYFCNNKIDPLSEKIKMRATCGEKECIYHWIRCDVVLKPVEPGINQADQLSGEVELEGYMDTAREIVTWPWDRIQEVILTDKKITFDEAGHILWDHLFDKKYSKRKFFGVERPINQWLYFCKREIDPRNISIRMKRLCDHKDCINPDHWINIEEDEAIYQIKLKKLSDSTKRDSVSGCLLWTGPLYPSGYGITCFDGHTTTAHILSMKIHRKCKKLPQGTLVRHKCKNKHCVEITHLETGDVFDNARDKFRDETQFFARLSDTDISEIVNSDKMSSSELAELYGMSRRAIEAIQSGKAYRHITNPNEKVTKSKYYLSDKTPESFWERHTKYIKDKMRIIPDNSIKEPHWVWIGAINARGYGVAHMAGRSLGAHKKSWMIHHRREVPEGQVVRHKCRRTDCCNPGHLEIGTPKDNSGDMKRDGTRRLNTHITEETATLIFKKFFNDNMTQIDIVRELGVTRDIVQKLVTNKTWSLLRANLIKNGTISIPDETDEDITVQSAEENQYDDYNETEYETLEFSDDIDDIDDIDDDIEY